MIRVLLLTALVAGGEPCHPEALSQCPIGTGDGMSLPKGAQSSGYKKAGVTFQRSGVKGRTLWPPGTLREQGFSLWSLGTQQV